MAGENGARFYGFSGGANDKPTYIGVVDALELGLPLAKVTETGGAPRLIPDALAAKLGKDPASVAAALEAVAASLPTTPPAGTGKLWLNDGVPTFTPRS